MRSLRTESTDKLFSALLNLHSVDELYDFFEDLCTVKELRDMSQRLEVAQLLDTGLSYQEISSRTGISSATISRVNKCLAYGSGGYRTVLDRTKAEVNHD